MQKYFLNETEQASVIPFRFYKDEKLDIILKKVQPVLSVVHVNNRDSIAEHVLLKKRLFDIAFASLIIIIGIPGFLVLYLITKLSSNGPAFYKQERIGRNGRSFVIYKFRSM